MKTNSIEEIQYQEALQRVKKIKGFYSHLLVYVVINLMIVIVNIQGLKPGESYFQWQNFFTAFFWGIGLLTHALSTFMPHWIFGRTWEENKIREFMEKDRQNLDSWQ